MFKTNAYFEKATASLTSDYLDIVVEEFLEHVNEGTHCNIVNTVTGEVLAYANHNGEHYFTDCISTMIAGLVVRGIVGE